MAKLEFSAAITPVFSVTWFFRNHINMQFDVQNTFIIIIIINV